MKVGYARVSTAEQNADRQTEMFAEMLVEKVFTDKASGKDTERTALKEMLAFVREGDTLIVESISRLARNTKDLLNIVEKLNEKKVAFVSVKENIDTATPTGVFMLTVFGALAQLERDCINQRAREGIELAKKRGVYKGRVPIKVDESKFKAVVSKWRNGEITAVKAQEMLGLKPMTFYRRVKELGA